MNLTVMILLDIFRDGLVESLPVLKDVVITRKEGDEAAATEHESAHRHYEIDLRDKV